MSFVPCGSCRRHVRDTEGACPFCGCAVSGAAAVPAARGRLPRRYAMAFATAMVAGCSSETVTPVYGAPAPDAATDSAADTSVQDTGLPGTLYGGPPVDGGK